MTEHANTHVHLSKWLRRRSRWVRPDTHHIFKFLPKMPPERNEIVLVDGVRCRVLRAKVSWDGPQWTIHGVKVVDAS